ncbi:MAG: hypothetical protein M1837_002377 [Sclerophora amabilis]|nr:MAG: hypothetical protein M1837_002377 [Sclerophora amabilis]
MYGRRDSRPLSYFPQQNDEVMVSSPPTPTESPHSPPGRAPLSPTALNERPSPLMKGRGPSLRTRNAAAPAAAAAAATENGPPSPSLSIRDQSSMDAANAHFPLSDVDYESNPAAVAKEMSNLQALRRMSLVDNAAADPDLPGYKSPLMPAVAPTGADDEEDTSRLFWVPARIHPELAPKEFKTFLENRVDQIKRRSGEEALSPDGLQRQDSGSSLRRKRSMLSRQIDNSGGTGGDGYKDGAERLERKRSLSGDQAPDLKVADLQDLDSLKDPSKLIRKLSIDTSTREVENKSPVSAEDDTPILPAVPPGNSLRRSTRTTYRRGSLRKGERVAVSKRAARVAETDAEDSPVSPPISPPTTSPGSNPELKLSRAQLEPVRAPEEYAKSASHSIRPSRGQPLPQRSPPPSSPEESSLPSASSQPPARASAPPASFSQRVLGDRAGATLNRSSTGSENDRTKQVPRIIETPPPPGDDEPNAGPSFPLRAHIPERKSSHEPPPSLPPQGPLPQGPSNGGRPANRGGLVRQAQNARNTGQTLDDIVGQPSPLPGNSTRTDSLSFIPTFSEEKKGDKKSKDRKDKDGGEPGVSRKSSWGWLLGSEEKDKDKDGHGPKKSRIKGSSKPDKTSDSTRLDLLQTSIDGGRGRESLVLDRESVKLDEERKKESSRKSSGGEPRKEKESSLFSSFFGGVKKKGDRESVGRKDRSSRTLSPDPPHRMLKPDIDYNWTRFSMLEERAIYRMAHIKLANPRRALCSQVLLSNFMYSYLAKVQQMHPQVPIAQAAPQKQQQQRQQQHQQPQPQQMHAEQEQHHQQQDGQYYQYHDQQGGGAQYVDDSQMYDYDGPDNGDSGRPQSRASSHNKAEAGNGYGNQYYHQQQQQQQQQQQHGSSANQNQYHLQSQFDDNTDGSHDDEMW